MLSQWSSSHVTPVILLFLFRVINHSEGQLDSTLVIYPNQDDQIVSDGGTLNLTCIIEIRMYTTNFFDPRTYNISWMLPEHLTKNEIEIRKNGINHRLRHSFGVNETHLWSTMTFTNTNARDTGYYSCIGIFVPQYKVEFVKKKFVYFFNYKQNVFKIESGAISFQTGEDVFLPCIATHPNVTISLLRRTDSKISTDLLSERYSRWSIERKKGLKLNKSTLDDRGGYACVGTMNNNTNNQMFNVDVYGLELTKLGGSEDPLEGTNVTLICRSWNESLRWYEINGEFGKSEILNIIHSLKGMDITQKGDANFVVTSNLTILEVPLNAITKFQCSTHDGKYSKVISFRVREMENKTVTVRMEKEKPQNLTCIKPLEKYNIQWRKDGKLYSSVYSDRNSIVLPLQGSVDEIGNYTCHWNNSLGNARYNKFIVTHIDQTNSKSPEENMITIAVSVVLAILLIISIIVGVQMYLKKKWQVLRAEKLLNGNVKNLNPALSVEEQTEQLPYDKRWEFPKHRLKLGSQLGAGCFGVVVKAEAVGIKGSDEISKTVAVKTMRSKTNVTALEDLVAELKVLIYLGSHLNVINLLGACTTKIHKGELFIIVEYCQFGNLKSYMIKNQKYFTNQVDEFGCMKHTITAAVEIESDPNKLSVVQQQRTEIPVSCVEDSFGYMVPNSPIDELDSTPQTDPSDQQSFSTNDLVSWSFQIARGMGYLSSKKVLHGDLAARNILLANNRVVKVADFGMARKMYYEDNYKKNGQSLMPIKWMAPESLMYRILSTQSDVWSYGILLWEVFSLGKVPYPDIDTKELIKELENGYRMEKPNCAPNFIGDVMNHCWKKEPSDRPSFNQIEEIIGGNLESSVSSYYSNLNVPYEKFNEDKTVAPKTERFGLAKLLNDNPKLINSRSQPVRYGAVQRYSRTPETLRLS